MDRRKFFAILSGAAAFVAAPFNKSYAKVPRHTVPLHSDVWLLCDGKELKRETYPELYEVMGAFPYLKSDDINIFKLPDLTKRERKRYIPGGYYIGNSRYSEPYVTWVTEPSPFKHWIKSRTDTNTSIPVGCIIMTTGSDPNKTK